MADWKSQDFLLLIPKLQRTLFTRVLQKKNTKNKIANRLAWIYTSIILVIVFFLLVLIIHFGSSNDVPIIKNIGDFAGLKYLIGVPKFDVKIDSPVRAHVNTNTNLSFTIKSYEQVSSRITVYLRPYDVGLYVPSYKYEKEKLLNKGETDNNKINIELVAPNQQGDFEICMMVDDRSFFSFNKYDDCPSTLEVRT